MNTRLESDCMLKLNVPENILQAYWYDVRIACSLFQVKCRRLWVAVSGTHMTGLGIYRPTLQKRRYTVYLKRSYTWLKIGTETGLMLCSFWSFGSYFQIPVCIWSYNSRAIYTVPFSDIFIILESLSKSRNDILANCKLSASFHLSTPTFIDDQ